MSAPAGSPVAANEPKLVLIAAVALNGVIGKNNDMPWSVPSDLKYFKRLTVGKPLIMGRRTFQAIGRSLPGRPNLVVSSDRTFAADGIETFPDLDAARARARDLAADLGAGEIMIGGGGQIYAQAIAQADRLEITEIQASPEGDTLFPEIDDRLWRCVSKSEPAQGPRDSASIIHLSYERVRTAPDGELK